MLRVVRSLAGALLAAALIVAIPRSGAMAAPLPTWPTNPNWQSLVPGPSSSNVRPVSVVRTQGSVTNAGALTGQSTGTTVLNTTSGGTPAAVVLDFGKEVGGTPFITVSGSTPTP